MGSRFQQSSRPPPLPPPASLSSSILDYIKQPATHNRLHTTYCARPTNHNRLPRTDTHRGPNSRNSGANLAPIGRTFLSLGRMAAMAGKPSTNWSGILIFPRPSSTRCAPNSRHCTHSGPNASHKANRAATQQPTAHNRLYNQLVILISAQSSRRWALRQEKKRSTFPNGSQLEDGHVGVNGAVRR